MDEVTPGRALREAVAQGTIMVPGAPFALFARLVERMGLQAVYLSGGAFSAGTLGLPDVGLFTLTELVQQATYLVRSVNLPVIVDADTGFGDTINVERTVYELEAVGVAAIQLEDQQLPKRCGHLSGKSLVSVEEMCAKIRAAADSRYDNDLVLIARTDARGVSDMDDAVERAQAYVAAGADWIFVEALASEEEFERAAREIEAPLLANMTEFGKSPLLPFSTFERLEYAVVLYPVTMLRVAMRAMEVALASIIDDGSQSELLDLMQTRQELYDLLDYDDYVERDRAHFTGGE